MTATYNFAMIREMLETLQSKIVEIKREICNIQEKLEIVSYVIEDFENFQKKENIGTSENYENYDLGENYLDPEIEEAIINRLEGL